MLLGRKSLIGICTYSIPVLYKASSHIFRNYLDDHPNNFSNNTVPVIAGLLSALCERECVQNTVLSFAYFSSTGILLFTYRIFLFRHSQQVEDIPIVIGGKEYRTDNVQYQVMVRINCY
jgi:hypothetical protein